MDKEAALTAFGALAHPTRIDAFRALVRAAPQGLLAGEIAGRLGVRQNTMSTNLAVLLRAGLVSACREGRAVRYRADIAGMRSLIIYLMQDCCAARPEICGDLAQFAACED